MRKKGSFTGTSIPSYASLVSSVLSICTSGAVSREYPLP